VKGLRVSWTALSALALGAAACSNKPPPTPAFVFVRPEKVEFVCINPEGTSSEAAEGGVVQPLVLPLRCCAPATPLNSEAFFKEGERSDVCGDASPSLHALVTQSTRGEVAAVDLYNREVLDSDPRIPGYTFVDVGGLPRAIVAPPHKPGEPDVGPPWTYVASAEEQSLRAVATCHFREGASCGPEAGFDLAELKIALPAQPKDMLFVGPDKEHPERANALWITLPDLSAIARVSLATDGDAPFGADKIAFFQVPVVDAMPLAPIREVEQYQSACGLGYALDLDAAALELPVTPPVSGASVAAPTRLRFDAESGLLFVADASQPVIHAFSVEPKGLGMRGAVATGAPIRDFALTGAVPKLAPSPRAFVRPERAKGAKKDPPDPRPEFGADEQRYLYAIDDRDGSVMVQTFAYDAGKITAQPLLLPATRKRADRLELTSPALAIDIADNRPLSNSKVCDWARDAALDTDEDKSAISKARAALEKAEEALNEAKDAVANAEPRSADLAAKEKASDKAQANYDKKLDEYNALAEERAILDEAGRLALRGVFALITTVDGHLGVVDVHDLDVFCRGERWCESSTKLVEDDDAALPVAVRRHALRLYSAAESEFTVSDPAAFDAVDRCEEGKYAAAKRGAPIVTGGEPGGAMDAGATEAGVSEGPEGGTGDASVGDASVADAGASAPDGDTTTEGDVLVCSTTDPWLNTYAPGWVAKWEGAVFSDFAGQLEVKGESITLKPAQGVDLCERGVIGAEPEVEKDYQGDWVVLVGAPPSYAPETCEEPEPGSEPHFRILRASKSELVLERTPSRGKFNPKCYPDVTAYEIRARERFFVYPRTAQYFHRVTANADGLCIADPTKDERLVARAKPGQPFNNAFANFKISKNAPRDSEILIGAEPTGTNAPLLPPVFDGPESQTDSLPVTIRYLGLTGEAYVVDVAQGLRRFPLRQFVVDTTPYR